MVEQLLLFPEILDWEKEQKIKEIESRRQKFQVQLKKARKNYDADELAFQDAQDEWRETSSNQSWQKMFHFINLAVFNCINQKLVRKVEQSEIEQKALDVTMNIMNNIKNKRAKGEFWEILRLSSFVHLPCLAIYQEQAKFEDSVLDESAYLFRDDKGNEVMMETPDSYLSDGIFHINRD